MTTAQDFKTDTPFRRCPQCGDRYEVAPGQTDSGECPACYERFRAAVLSDPRLGRHFRAYERLYKGRKD